MQRIDPPVTIRMTFRSDPLAVRAALAGILSDLAPLDLPQDTLADIEIVLAEALNNVVEHAYPPDTGVGPVDLDCRFEPDGLHVRITDCGRAMPGGKLPASGQVSLDRALADLPEGGFGWNLICTLARDVEYRRLHDRNILNLRLPVA